MQWEGAYDFVCLLVESWKIDQKGFLHALILDKKNSTAVDFDSIREGSY